MQDDIEVRAIEWHIRLRHGDEATWDAFVAWLAQDSRHATAYEQIEHLDAALGPMLLASAKATSAADLRGEHRRWYRKRLPWAAGGLVAASAGVLLLVIPGTQRDVYAVETAAGEHRTVALEGGVTIALNGDTRLQLDRDQPRYAVLDKGEALFRVRHDENAPFVVMVGTRSIKDLGTVFNVVRDGRTMRIAVAEGAVVFDPEGQNVRVPAGAMLSQDDPDRPPRLDRTTADAVGGWEQGVLVYSEAPLSRVAADLSRSLGVPISIAPDIASRAFSGSIILKGRSADQLAALGPALQIRFKRVGSGWIMTALEDNEI